MLHGAPDIAADGKAGLPERLAAVDLLGRLPDRRAKDAAALARLLTPQSPTALQSAAVAALGRIPDDRVPALLTAAWRGCTPPLQSQILDVLLSRPAWQRRLLQGIEKKHVPANQIDLARRQRLLASKDQEVRSLSAKLFQGATSRDRQKVLDAYRDVTTLVGDPGRGKAVFARTCAACHLLEAVGHAVGPDLGSVTNRSPEFLLIAILDPNREVDPRYVEYVASTKEGRSFTGILAAESAGSVTLRGQDGREEVLLRTDVEELQSTGKSLMPEGMEKDLRKQDLADLLAYLGRFAAPPKRFPGNTPAAVRPEGGRLALLATNAEIHGDEIRFEEPFRNIGYWHGAGDYAVWTVELARGGEYDVYLDWACDDGVAGNPYVLEGARPALRGQVAGTGGWDRYRQQKIGTVTLSAGRQRLTFRPDRAPRGALLDLRGIHLVPKGQKLPGG
jgi:putative heme-binding domain-containing protein